MRRSAKPVRKCHACPLNQGDHCWIYRYPRGQWREDRRCPGYGDLALQAAYREWLKQPTVKTRKQLRREFFRTRLRTEIHHVPPRDRH